MFQPQRIGRYLLIRKIATGGMAEIFLAKLLGAEGFEKEVVIKKILPQWSSDHDFISMLIDEAKIAVQLNHPHVVSVLELAREGEIFYIAMEYLHGVDLRRLMQKASAEGKKIPFDLSLAIMGQLLEGLAYAHSKKDSRGQPLEIVHRDISPQNILVSFDGTTKITDFGIAKAASRSHETMVGVLKGKFAYMSPEQANQELLDGRSDLYSAAIILYELVTGERLFSGDSDLGLLDRVRRGQVTFSEKGEKQVPSRLKEILLKALSKERENRYPDAALFRDDLHRFARRAKKELRREKVASFVSNLFMNEAKEEREEETQILTQITSLLLEETRSLREKEIFVSRPETATVVLPPKEVHPKSVSRQLLGAALLAMLSLGLILFIVSRQGARSPSQKTVALPPPVVAEARPPEVVPPIKQDQVMAALEPKKEDPVSGALPTQAEAKKSSPAEKNGYLSVQAIPWGYVTIDGGNRRWETPLRRLPIKAGPHTIKVLYEPDGSITSASIKIVAADEIVCVANFREEKEKREGKQIRCGR